MWQLILLLYNLACCVPVALTLLFLRIPLPPLRFPQAMPATGTTSSTRAAATPSPTPNIAARTATSAQTTATAATAHAAATLRARTRRPLSAWLSTAGSARQSLTKAATRIVMTMSAIWSAERIVMHTTLHPLLSCRQQVLSTWCSAAVERSCKLSSQQSYSNSTECRCIVQGLIQHAMNAAGSLIQPVVLQLRRIKWY
jgi:hypothetical protein